MRRNYYCLVAGLPDISLDDNKLNYTVANFKSELCNELSSSDKKLIDLFYLKFDNANVLTLLKDIDAEIDTRGNYTSKELIDLITNLKTGGAIKSKNFPLYLTSFINKYLKAEDKNAVQQENYLATLYYEYAMKCNNKFVSSWFEYNMNINNILTALACRKYKWSLVDNIVGNSSICKALRTSNDRDFGVSEEVPLFEPLLKISEIIDLVEREKKLDILRWDWMEENTFFDYFSIERIFVFLLKLEMIERWISLDSETGSQAFRSIIDSLKNEVQIPAEFRQ